MSTPPNAARHYARRDAVNGAVLGCQLGGRGTPFALPRAQLATKRPLCCQSMKSRRRIASPKGSGVRRLLLTGTRLQQGFTTGGMGSDHHFAWQQSSGPNVRFGSEADIEAASPHVRFTPESGHWNSVVKCPLCAKSGHSPNDCLKLNQLKEHHSAGFQS